MSGGVCGCLEYLNPDQGNPANCCTNFAAAGLCCIPTGMSDGGDPDQCCSGLAPNTTCICIPTGMDANGAASNCCSGQTNGQNCT
jgi:hypothetical protein